MHKASALVGKQGSKKFTATEKKLLTIYLGIFSLFIDACQLLRLIKRQIKG
jgi:hypothetical protein